MDGKFAHPRTGCLNRRCPRCVGVVPVFPLSVLFEKRHPHMGVSFLWGVGGSACRLATNPCFSLKDGAYTSPCGFGQFKHYLVVWRDVSIRRFLRLDKVKCRASSSGLKLGGWGSAHLRIRGASGSAFQRAATPFNGSF